MAVGAPAHDEIEDQADGQPGDAQQLGGVIEVEPDKAADQESQGGDGGGEEDFLA